LSWNFAIQPRLPIPEGIKAIDFPKSLSASTDGLTFQHTEGERTFYTLKAKKHESFTDAPHQFFGVEVTIYGNETDPERHIAADSCTYDPRTGDIDFNGNVVAHLDENTTGRTAALSYLNKGRLARTRSRITVERPGEMTAAANSMEFGVESGVLKLAGKVHATLASGAELDANAAVFHQHESWATVSGNVFVRSTTGWARGEDGRAELEPGTFRPRMITVRGNVVAEIRSSKNDEVWELKRAEKMDLFMTETGGIDRVTALGDARLEKRAESESRKLSGGALMAWVDGHGDVERVEASEGARLEAGAGDRVTHLTAAGKIRIDPSGTIRTEGASTMDSADSKITGRDFVIEQGDISTFATLFPANVETRRSGAPPRSMQAEQSTTARIDGKTNKLISLVSIGSVQFTDGDRRGNADKATVTDGGDTIVLEGKATVIDPKTTVHGNRIKIGQKGATFEASGAVTTVTQSESGPVKVTANEARGSSGGVSEKVFYSGNVTTTADTESGRVRINASQAEGDSAEMTYTGSIVDTIVQTETGPVRIIAERVAGRAGTLVVSAEKMTYTVAVQLWRVHDSVHIQSERLELWPKEKRFKAEGKVVSEMDTLKGNSATLEYSDASKQTARYSGNVQLWQKDMTIVASQVTVGLKDGRISDSTAEGAVTVTRGGATGTGDRAVYEANGEKVTLTGRPARIVDKARGDTQGDVVTMDRTTGNATVTGSGEGGQRGRVTTRTPVPR
jgi:LPS export ABC transporter protein LptC/lipopolysaccharide transport protein LptA